MELPVKRPPHSSTLKTRYKLQTKNLSYKLSPPILFGDFSWLPWKCTSSTNDKYILENVSCEAKPGEVTAIAGPSGVGKTTLLEILSGTIAPRRVSSGHVLVNDEPMDAARFRRLSGYVAQDEALFPLLTVEETLTYSARLRANDDGSGTIGIRVWKLLKVLGLEHVAGARVGSESCRGISGGEKRRLSIGVDLVHDPPVLLLDEPTSGLDSASALDVMLLLKSMALDQHKTIVVTIHQPGFRILDSLDRVILLSNGTVLHNGSLRILEERLRSAGHDVPCHVNVLEFSMDVVSENLLLRKDDNGNVESTCHQSVMEEALSYSNSPFKEIVILSQRFSSNVFRTKQLFLARTSQSLLAGIVLGTIFIDSFGDRHSKRGVRMQNQMGFFAFSLTFLMSSTTEALPIFLQERRILMRDTSRGAYRVSSYVVANTLVFLPFLLVVALLYATPVYWLVGLRREMDGFLYFTLVVWMVVLASNSFVACFSAIVPDYITGMSVIAGVMGSFFLFSGYFVSKDDIPRCWRFMQYLSLFRYPFECFMINEYGGERGRSKCLESIDGGGCLVYGGGFLMQQGLKEKQKWNNLVMMLGIILGYRVVGFVFLRLRCYKC